MDWLKILTKVGVRQSTATRWAPVFGAHAGALGQQAAADFVGQVLVESAMLERLEENLRYSTPERIAAVWPRRFPSAESAVTYVRNPEALANFVYGGRMGNTSPGDGWRFRGRGLLMVTGRSNYASTGSSIGVDLVAEPDRLAEPDIALRASLAWWAKNIKADDIGDVVAITKRVNGSSHALNERRAMTILASTAIA